MKRARESDSTKELQKKSKQKSFFLMVSKRASSVLLETAIADFLSKVQYGPNYVCMSCHRMMYRKSVIDFQRAKYTKATCEVLDKVFSPQYKRVSPYGNMYVCRTCHLALCRGNVPLLS